MLARPISVLLAAAVLGGSALVAVSADEGRRSDVKADPAAYALLKEAHDNRDSFPPGFKGFTADIVVDDNGTVMKGTLTYAPGTKNALTLELKDVSGELKEITGEMRSMF